MDNSSKFVNNKYKYYEKFYSILFYSILFYSISGLTAQVSVSLTGNMGPCPNIEYTYTAQGSGCPNGACEIWNEGSLSSTSNNTGSYSFVIQGGTVTSVNGGTANVIWSTNCLPTTNAAQKPKLTVTYRCTSFTQRVLKSSPLSTSCDPNITTATSVIEPEVKCVKITASPISSAVDCCNEPNKDYSFTFETYGIGSSSDLEISWPGGLEQQGTLELISDVLGYKTWRVVFHTSSSFGNSGNVILTAKSPCGTSYDDSKTVAILREYRDPTWSNVPSALCLGNSHTLCLDFNNTPCYTVVWKIYRYSENGTLLSTSTPVTQTSGYCFLAISQPTANTCNEKMKIEATVTSPCILSAKVYNWEIKTPATVPGSGNSPVPTMPTVICPCKSVVNFYADIDCATTQVEWYVTNDPNNTWQQSGVYNVNSPFQVSFCSQYLWGVNPLPTGPFQDMTIQWRRKNDCGWGPWGQSIIPASYFYPAGSPECPETN